MNYEEKYKEALKSMRDFYNKMKYLSSTDALATTATLENTFPELKESEDERIRKELISFFTKRDEFTKSEPFDGLSNKKIIAWLEKQGEQKPVEQDTEIHDLWVYIREWNEKFGRLPKDEDELEACIDYVTKRQKPSEKVEQSYYHNEGLYYAIDILEKTFGKVEGYQSDDGIIEHQTAIETVNALYHKKPNHWKPSEEQMEALNKAKNSPANYHDTRLELQSLYDDLKKL